MPVSQSGTNDDNVIFETGKGELWRVTMQHMILRSVMKNLVLAPLDFSKPGLRILDQATADGLWLKDVREQATAKHEYVGTDIEDSYFPNPPPENTKFYHQSMTEPWPADFQSSFDLVHSRLALAGAGTNSIRDVVMNLIGLVKPGGYIQLVELLFEDWPGTGPAVKDMQTTIKDVFFFVSGGQGCSYLEWTQEWFKEAGLEDVKFEIITAPVGRNAKTKEISDISVASMSTTSAGLKETAKVLPAKMTLSPEQLESLPNRVKEELETSGGSFQVFAIYGRKPANA